MRIALAIALIGISSAGPAEAVDLNPSTPPLPEAPPTRFATTYLVDGSTPVGHIIAGAIVGSHDAVVIMTGLQPEAAYSVSDELTVRELRSTSTGDLVVEGIAADRIIQLVVGLGENVVTTVVLPASAIPSLPELPIAASGCDTWISATNYGGGSTVGVSSSLSDCGDPGTVEVKLWHMAKARPDSGYPGGNYMGSGVNAALCQGEDLCPLRLIHEPLTAGDGLWRTAKWTVVLDCGIAEWSATLYADYEYAPTGGFSYNAGTGHPAWPHTAACLP